ncbi:MAG: 2-oxoacid:acceptor oxidoreductase family protein [Nitrospinota bacterium]
MTGSPDNGDIPYPGVPTTADGAGAVVWVETHICQGACAYPITSSTTMGQGFQQAVANGQKNLWGERLAFLELESEHSSASTCEGFALAGGRVSNFTSGQGLVLMKEVLYTISGKRLPAVFHIGARALTSHSLNVHAGHDDVMAVADCGWSQVFARTAQEAGDLALISRRAAEDSLTPFLNIQDGFLTTHTIENVRLLEPGFMREFVGDPNQRLQNLMDFGLPIMTGVVQNQDSYMKGKIAQRAFYDRVPHFLERAFEEFFRATGRRYDFLDGYRMEGAEYAIVGMGSAMETAVAAADYLREREGLPVGVVHVTVFRPFPGPQLVRALKGVKAFSVIERMDNPLAQSNPLTSECKAAFADALVGTAGYPRVDRIPEVFSGSAGLGSRDIRPGDFVVMCRNMLDAAGKRFFVVGIEHPLALKRAIDPDVRPPGAFSMRGHSVGGYGSVTTNKVIASLLEDIFGLYVQAYPKYGSEKKGLPTTYYLTVAEAPIKTHCELEHVEFVPMNDVNAFNIGNPLEGLREAGMIFIQTDQEASEAIWAGIPGWAKRVIREKNLRVFCLDTVKIAREVSSRPDLVQRMQGIVLLGIFLRCTPFVEQRGLSEEKLLEGVERSLRKYFGTRGEQVVQDNLRAVRRGFEEVFEVPREIIEKTETVEVA